MSEKHREIKDWEKTKNPQYWKVGDDGVILYDMAIYDYEYDCWRYAPDVLWEYVYSSNEADHITEKEAKKTVEKYGGKNFDKKDKLLYVDDGKYYSGIFEADD